MNNKIIYARMPGKVVMVGFGAIGQGVLPLLFRHFGLSAEQVQIISLGTTGESVAKAYGVAYRECALRPDNYRAVLEPLLEPDDFLLNLAVDVSSMALMALCQERGALYLDTCIEPWAGGYTDKTLSLGERSNYTLREQALSLKARYPQGHTAVLAQGANPGMVSHLLKQALWQLQQDILGRSEKPVSKEAWGHLAQDLGIKVIHIAERDTQRSAHVKQSHEFVNTWSCEGFVSEGMQPAELGWGTHEHYFPVDGHRHAFGCGAAIYLDRPGTTVQVRSWTPDYGPFYGFLITHNEAISIADFLTVRDAQHKVVYRPTCHYAYHPCDAAVLSVHEFNGRGFQMQPAQRILSDEIQTGMDELGVLLAGHAKGAYWYGSQLTIQEARALAPYNSATSLQVACAVLAGMVWAIQNPRSGIVESDDIDFESQLAIMGPYLGRLQGAYTDWTPLSHRERLFAEKLDRSDPWQFKNIRVYAPDA